MVRKDVIFVLGGPASGKGTLCTDLGKTGLNHISVGDMMRDEVKKNTPESSEMKRIIAEGKLIPSNIVVELLRKRILNSDAERFLVDGFPRSLDNLEQWRKMIKPEDDIHARDLLLLECCEDTMMERIMYRRSTTKDPRIDDNQEVFKNRIRVYNQETITVINELESSIRIHRLDSEGDAANTLRQATEAIGSSGMDDCEEHLTDTG